MGVLIIAEEPPAGSAYNQWKVYRATSKTGTYSVINTQATTDLSYYDSDGDSSSWYKIAYYDSDGDNTSAQSSPQQGMSETYTTVRKVENFMGLTTLTDSTNPTIEQVVELINKAEDEIDYRTNHAWRERYSGTDSGLDHTANYEYHDIVFPYENKTGRAVYLKHRKVKSLNSSEGDALSVWDGSEWVDWLSDYTEGRDEDYWLDYEQGILYLKTRYSKGIKKLRIKYRFGESSVNRLVEDVATKMVAKNLLLFGSRVAIVPEGSAGLKYQQRIDILQKDIDTKLDSLKEFVIPEMNL